MVSPEVLRRYRFFANLNEEQLNNVALISEECSFEAGDILFLEDDTADKLFILLTGVVDLYFTVEKRGGGKRDYPVEAITAGDPFGISALIEPYVFTSNARAAQSCQVIRINGVTLRELCIKDPDLRNALTRQTAKIYAERLRSARSQLASNQE